MIHDPKKAPSNSNSSRDKSSRSVTTKMPFQTIAGS